jgi:ribosome-binding protein aMBF1 (putative translation factor)
MDSSRKDTDTYTIRSSAAVSAARTHVRHNAGAAAAAKMEDAEIVRVKLLTPDSVRAIQDYRRENSLTQKQLDQRCSFPVNTVNGLESRRAGPTVGQLRDLNRLLKSGLTIE